MTEVLAEWFRNEIRWLQEVVGSGKLAPHIEDHLRNRLAEVLEAEANRNRRV